MAVFAYTARSLAGRKVEGTVEAEDRRAALARIQRLGHVPITVAEGAAPELAAEGRPRLVLPWRRPRLRTREVLLFTTELSDLLASGMSLGRALNTLAARHQRRSERQVIGDLRDQIVQGASLSAALGDHPDSFSNLYVSMIRAGESSGAMHEVLQRLVAHYERVQETKEKVVTAMVYPAIVLGMGFLTLVFAMTVVLPKFRDAFDQLGQAMPMATKMLIAGSEWTARYGLFVAAGAAVAAMLIRRALKTGPGRQWRDRLFLRLPGVRGIVSASVYATFARTLGTLLANGVPVLQALGIVEKTVTNAVIAREIGRARERVTDGTTISGPLAAGKIFPPLMIDMLAVGEQAGDMSVALERIARRYENELARNLKIFTTALEPILIVLVAVAIGFVAVSILSAVFNMTDGLGV